MQLAALEYGDPVSIKIQEIRVKRRIFLDK